MELERHVGKGEAINPWIFAGPLVLDDIQEIFDFFSLEPYEGLETFIGGKKLSGSY